MAGLFLKRTPNVAHLRVLLLEYWRRRLSARGLYTTASGGSFPFIFRKTYTIIHLFCSDFVLSWVQTLNSVRVQWRKDRILFVS